MSDGRRCCILGGGEFQRFQNLEISEILGFGEPGGGGLKSPTQKC